MADEIKARMNLADIVGIYGGVDLGGFGLSEVRQGLCPFPHNGKSESNASFTVYRESQEFHCFGCGSHGDAINFVSRVRHISLGDAGEQILGLSVPAATKTPTPDAEILLPSKPVAQWTSDVQLLTMASRFYGNKLIYSDSGVAAREYLAGRGISMKTAAEWQLGYGNGIGLYGALIGAGMSRSRINRSGLVSRGRERFTGYITVPEITEDGDVIWITGRAIRSDTVPKFHAVPGRKPLLGKGRLGSEHLVYLTEGLFHLLTLAEWGLPAVSLAGETNPDQARDVLESLAERSFALVFDRDDAGERQALWLHQELQHSEIITLPDGIVDVADLAVVPDGRQRFLIAVSDSLGII